MKNKKDDVRKRTAKENINFHMEGIWWDVIYERDSDENETIIRTSKKHNTIMIKVTNLMAGLFKNDANFPSGLAYHALGIGSSSWDSSPTPPSPSQSNEYLEDEYFRKTIDTSSNVDYIDGSGLVFSPTGTPGVDYTVQPRLRIKTTFDYGEANGEWIREQAIFGGDATGSLDSGHIINIIRHPRIRKEDNIKIDRYVQFSFILT